MSKNVRISHLVCASVSTILDSIVPGQPATRAAPFGPHVTNRCRRAPRRAETTTLSSQSDVLFRTAFSPVRAVWNRHPREPTQHVRTACARNPYVPRVLGDRVAYARKRRPRNDGVLPGQSGFEFAPARSDATRAQQVRHKPLHTKGSKRSRRFGGRAYVSESRKNQCLESLSQQGFRRKHDSDTRVKSGLRASAGECSAMVPAAPFGL